VTSARFAGAAWHRKVFRIAASNRSVTCIWRLCPVTRRSGRTFGCSVQRRTRARLFQAGPLAASRGGGGRSGRFFERRPRRFSIIGSQIRNSSCGFLPVSRRNPEILSLRNRALYFGPHIPIKGSHGSGSARDRSGLNCDHPEWEIFD
jgi:hypothetical protein